MRWIIRDADDPTTTEGVYTRSRVAQSSHGRRQRAIAALLGLVYLEGRLLDATEGKSGSGAASARVSGMPSTLEADAEAAAQDDERLSKGLPAADMTTDVAI